MLKLEVYYSHCVSQFIYNNKIKSLSCLNNGRIA